jgi:hypothetical protein
MNGFIRQKFPRCMNFLAESPWVAYTGVILLQAKVMFWVWKYRDLAPGDTSYYYLTVYDWLKEGKGSIARSPLYTLFLAGLHKFVDNPFWALTTARIAIAICASLLVLALLRRLLPKHIAWFIAAWWVVLPINFDTAYSVHLFSALFPLGLFVIAAYADNIYGRGVVLAGMLFTAALVRTEYVALFIPWLLALAGYEFYLRRWKGRHVPFRTSLVAYGLPLLVACLIIGIFIARSKPYGMAELKKEMEVKQTENMCQVYAYNRMQQGDPWQGNPWTQCEDILKRDFGKAGVTFPEAFFLNPRAILDHVWWNTRLIPSGIQLALFNYFSGGPNPDYMPARQSPLVWVPFWLVSGLAVFAAIRCLAGPDQLVENRFVWMLMTSSALLVLVIMMMQRPRPSYMYPFTVFIMAMAGRGLQVLLERLRTSNALRTLTSVAGVLLILLVPSYYDAGYINYYGYKGQPLLESFERISPHIDSSSESPLVIVTPQGDESLCNYLDGESCTTIQFKKITGPYLGYYLKSLDVNWIYLTSTEDKLPVKYDALQWKMVSQGANKKGSWALLHRLEPD